MNSYSKVDIKELYKKINNKKSGVVINWMMFGSSHLREKTNELVIKRFVYRSKECEEVNKHIKSIINPRHVVGFMNAHYPIYLLSHYAINLNDDRISGAFSDYYGDIFRINHYFTKSYEEYIDKMNRGKADGDAKREIIEFNKQDKNDIYDNSMNRYYEIIEKEL